jgi:hypothetical protein
VEECDFLDDICLTVLSASKEVSFAAVVDTNGKLIAGKYRKVDRRLITTSIANSSGQYSTTYLFYSDYLVRGIQRSYLGSRHIKEEAWNIEVNFDVIDINDNTKLAITPLYLCVYFESPLAQSYQEIIMKINNTI